MLRLRVESGGVGMTSYGTAKLQKEVKMWQDLNDKCMKLYSHGNWKIPYQYYSPNSKTLSLSQYPQ